MNLIIILCGGKGTRMNSDIPKVLHKVKGKSMLIRIVESSLKTNPDKIVLVVNPLNKQAIINELFEHNYMTHHIHLILQKESKGTGHAIQCCFDFLLNYKDHQIIILNGDVPFIREETIQKLNNKKSNIVVSELENPVCYGRIVVNDNNDFEDIIEEKDCNDRERKVDLVNSGIYSFKTEPILNNICKITNNNKQYE